MAPFVQDYQPQDFAPMAAPCLTADKQTVKPEKAHEGAEIVRNLSQLLVGASRTDGGCTFYSEHDGDLRSTHQPYHELLATATAKASLLQRSSEIPGTGSILLLHFETQHENIIWFWAATLAGFTPAISLPLSNDLNQRRKHLLHLHNLLQKPTVLTPQKLSPDFLGIESLQICHVESLELSGNSSPDSSSSSDLAGNDSSMTGLDKTPSDIAALMFTSGSTGNVKAVPLKHGQIVSAVRGKSLHHCTDRSDVFLNWVGLDHVASLTEIHLHAMSLGGSQIHVPASALLAQPLLFLRLLDNHQVSYTFAPNFFLTMVRDALVVEPSFMAKLDRLKALISGGESNPTATCAEITQALQRFGLQGEAVRPGFGMTETCAGSIYSLVSPSYDVKRGLEFASLGLCIPGMHMRVMNITERGTMAAAGESGELQVAGPMVFTHYYNNPAATRESFTEDGWFVTGDLAYIDENGMLNLVGRTKDTIIVNGVKWSATELEVAIEEERISGVAPSYTVVFPTRAANSPTEDIAVVYAPTYSTDDLHKRFETTQAISKVVSLVTGRNPARVVPLPLAGISKSTLGKISRSKMRQALESGELEHYDQENTNLLDQYRRSTWQSAETLTERIVARVVAAILERPEAGIDILTSIFELGVDSFTLIRLKAMIQVAVGAEVDIPMSVMLTDPTVRAISASIDDLMSKPSVYTPIVPLQPHGSGTPLFCIHPGSGDILVFIALAAHFTSRPVYALRSRGYNPNERFFGSIEETAETYAHHIRQVQPHGPYAVAGYSLGSTLAFEVGKVLEAQGQEVRFLASIDYPPHISHYVHKLNWIDVLLHIAFFLELIDADTMDEITPLLHSLGRDGALLHILKIGDAERAAALAIDKDRLALITDIAENFRVNVKSYEPVGSVEKLDVFVADPPRYAARDRQDWRENKLGRWRDFSRTETVFHDCPGIHAKMLNREHMADFAKIFKAAMRRRGV